MRGILLRSIGALAALFAALFAASLGAVTAQAAPISVNLVSVEIFEPLSGDPIFADLSGSTATWSWETTTGVVTGTGLLDAQFDLNQFNSLFNHSANNLVIGGGNSAAAASYSCFEGTFGPAVGASICGNYNFGGDGFDDSSLTYSGTSFSRTMGGDDVALGSPMNLADFDGMTTSLNGNILELNNFVLGANASYNIVFEAPVPVPAAAWLFGSALGLLGWMRRKAT